MGGGGGAGHGNNNVGMTGGNGGGIVFLIADVINGNNSLIRANGARPHRAGLADPYVAGGDGGAGGGGGGVIILDANNYIGNLNVEANGGRGSDASSAPSPGCFGPGGGGGGGIIWVKNASINPLINTSVVAGSNGVVSNTAGISACWGQSNSAASGTIGSVLTDYIRPVGVAMSCIPLSSPDLLSWNGKYSEGLVQLEWRLRDQNRFIKIEVERSNDQLRYFHIATIMVTNRIAYRATDKSQPSPEVYYRLKMYSRDGSVNYSHVIVLRKSIGDSFSFIKSFQSANKKTIHVSLESTVTESLGITIYDITGKRLETERREIEVGFNELEIEVGHLKSGMYFLRLHDKKQQAVVKFFQY